MDGGSGVGPDHSCVVGSSVEDAGISISLSLPLTKVVSSGANSSVSRTVVTEDRGVLGDCDGGGGGDIGGDHLGVMTHHVPGVDGLGGGLLTGGGDDLLAVLGDGGVHDLIILLVTLLPGGHHLTGVAGLHGDGDALGGGHSHGGRGVPVATSISVGLWSSLGFSFPPDEESLGGADKKEDGKKLHCVCRERGFTSHLEEK